MEGTDDPTFVAVGVFDLMSNARQLVQQIGRTTRYARGGDRERQTAWILGSPANALRIRDAWERYKRYEDYAARNTGYMVSNEVTLPDRLLEYMPEYQYIDGEFRGRFEFERPLAASDIPNKKMCLLVHFSKSRFNEPYFSQLRLEYSKTTY